MLSAMPPYPSPYHHPLRSSSPIPLCVNTFYLTAFLCPSKLFSFCSNIHRECHIAWHSGHVKVYYWHRMKSNIHIKRSTQEGKSDKEELITYSSSSLGDNEHGLIDTAWWRPNGMWKARNKSVASAIEISGNIYIYIYIILEPMAVCRGIR